MDEEVVRQVPLWGRFVIGVLAVGTLLLMTYWRFVILRRQRAQQALTDILERVEREEHREVCGFYFVSRELILSGGLGARLNPFLKAAEKAGEKNQPRPSVQVYPSMAKLIVTAGGSLREFQQLQQHHSKELSFVELSREAVLRGEPPFRGCNTQEYLVVSHRWIPSADGDKSEPDSDGVQLAAMQRYLNQNEAVKWVWFDYWSMPQNNPVRTRAEKHEFDWMLGNISLLFLSMPVLILLDKSYISRFWTNVSRTP